MPSQRRARTQPLRPVLTTAATSLVSPSTTARRFLQTPANQIRPFPGPRDDPRPPTSPNTTPSNPHEPPLLYTSGHLRPATSGHNPTTTDLPIAGDVVGSLPRHQPWPDLGPITATRPDVDPESSPTASSIVGPDSDPGSWPDSGVGFVFVILLRVFGIIHREANTQRLYLNCIRSTLEAAMCLQLEVAHHGCD